MSQLFIDDENNPQVSSELKELWGRLRSSIIPNKQNGSTRVPVVGSLKVLDYAVGDTSVDVVLRFDEPHVSTSEVRQYNVYVSGAILSNSFGAPYITKNSPAKFSVPITARRSGVLTFAVQTVLENGFSSPISESPTTSVQINKNKQFITDYSARGAGVVVGSYNIPANTVDKGSLVEIEINYFVSFPAGAYPASTGLGLKLIASDGTSSTLLYSGVLKDGADINNFGCNNTSKFKILWKTNNSGTAVSTTKVDPALQGTAAFPFIKGMGDGGTSHTLDKSKNITLTLSVFDGGYLGTAFVQVLIGTIELKNLIF